MNGVYEGDSSQLIMNYGKLEVDGPELIGNDYCIKNGSGIVYLKSGKIKCITGTGRAINGGKAEVSGGTIEGLKYGFIGKEFKMTNGDIISYSSSGVAIYSGTERGRIEIFGGTVKAGLENTTIDNVDGIVVYNTDPTSNCADIIITGGTIIGKRYGVLVTTNSTLTIGSNNAEISSNPSIEGLNNVGVATISSVNFSFLNGEIVGNINPPYMNVDTMRNGKTSIPITNSDGKYIAKYTNE